MDIKKLFEGLTDPRAKDNQTYPFECLLLIAVSAIMSGIDSFTGIEDYAETHKSFFDSYFKLTYTPTHDTFNRLFQILDINEFEAWFRIKSKVLIAFIEANNPPGLATFDKKTGQISRLKHIAIDGKTVRNSGFLKAYHIVTAWRVDHKIAIGQIKVEEKSNEITAIPVLIESLQSLDNTVVTMDAMGCQREICEKIIAKKGSYIIAVKENQPRLFENVRAQIEEEFETAYENCMTENKGHGRIEKRWCTAQDVDHKKFDFRNWPGIKTIYAIDSDILQKKRGVEKRHLATRYFVSNVKLSAEEALEKIRGHWGIEINLHWCLDVSLNEDGACIQLENAVVNFNVLRKFALNTLGVVKGKKSMVSMFRHCALPTNSINILDKFFHA
jgi:predicted transposase YbfD/YdcC